MGFEGKDGRTLTDEARRTGMKSRISMSKRNDVASSILVQFWIHCSNSNN